jgi:hypothetical protein
VHPPFETDGAVVERGILRIGGADERAAGKEEPGDQARRQWETTTSHGRSREGHDTDGDERRDGSG